jgi:hypothetical protein
MTPWPYLTGDMPSSAAAVNAIVGGSGREAVEAGSLLFRSFKTTPGRGERQPWVCDAPTHPSPLLPKDRRNRSRFAGPLFKVIAAKIA